MTIGELLDTLAARGGRLLVAGDRLRYHGPRLAEDDPARPALTAFRGELVWLLTSACLCVLCPRLLADGDKIACPVHRIVIDREISALSARNAIGAGHMAGARTGR